MHAHTLFSAGYIAYLLKNKYNIKYFVSVRNSDINTFFKYRKNLKGIGMEILKNADKIIFISKAYQEKLINKYVPKKLREDFIKKSIIMNNGLNEFWIENRFYLEGKDDNHNIQLLQVGEINKNKNLETTIKVVKKLNKMGYNTVLHIAGDGRRKNKIKKISSKNDKIIFYGKLKKEELLKLYRNSDIFVLPSKHETFGIVYIEAMSQSLPIIYSKGQGFDKVFEDGVVGYPIKYNSTKEMVEKIILIKEKYKEISKSSYEKSSLFDWKIIAKKYIELL